MNCFTVDQECDITAICSVSCKNMDTALSMEKIVAEKLTELAKKDKSKSDTNVEVSLSNYITDDPEGAYSEMEVHYSYIEECEGTEGHKSYDWYEPDEPAEIYALDDDEKEKEMIDDIEKAFSKAGFDCLKVEVNDSQIDSLSKLYERAEQSNEPDADFLYESYRDDR